MHRFRTYSKISLATAFLGVFSVVCMLSSVADASDIVPKTVVALSNADRSAQGLPLLSENEALMKAAQAKADDMAKNGYFAHTSPSGVTPWYWVKQSGYGYRLAGENLAIRFTNAESQEKAWMESVKHKENILNPKYRDTGVAVKHIIQDGQDVLITVQLFGLADGVVLPAQGLDMKTLPETAPEALWGNHAVKPSSVSGLSDATIDYALWARYASLWASFFSMVLLMIANAFSISRNRVSFWDTLRMRAHIFHH